LVLIFGATLSAAKKRDASSQPAQAMAAAPDEGGRTFVGSQQCEACHDAVAKSFGSSPHAVTLQKTRVTPEARGCESCHGPGSAHVEGGGDKSKIFRFGEATAERINQRCLTCHEANVNQRQFTRSEHAQNGVSCTTCHSVHQPAKREYLLKASQPNLCFSCHTAQRADFMKPFKHRVLEGLVNCTDCHNPHGTVTTAQVRPTPSQGDACVKCHSDKRGPFVYEHEPVRSEGCTSCHFPHGSTNPRMLLTARVNALCLQCHSQIPTGVHSQNNNFRQSCIICHANIHGSNNHRLLFR
jgi:DmsE family decaheme c-type cytochrome